MSDFIREARYYVIKQKNLTEDQDTALCDLLSGAQIPCTDCVVVEKDWRNYEHTWKTIEHVASGKFCDPYEEIDRLHLHIEQAHARLQSVHADLLEIHRVTAHVAGWTGEPLREDHLTVRRVKEMSIWLNRTVQELDRSRARVAELEHREDAMCDLHYANGAKQGFSWGQVSDEKALHQCVSARMSAGVSELVELRKAGGDL